MTKFQWEAVRKRKRAGEAHQPSEAGKKTQALRQYTLQSFVRTHELSCFRCGTAKAEWAKTGVNRRGPWAICVPCLKR